MLQHSLVYRHPMGGGRTQSDACTARSTLFSFLADPSCLQQGLNLHIQVFWDVACFSHPASVVVAGSLFLHLALPAFGSLLVHHTGAGLDLYQIQTLAFVNSGIGSH